MFSSQDRASNNIYYLIISAEDLKIDLHHLSFLLLSLFSYLSFFFSFLSHSLPFFSLLSSSLSPPREPRPSRPPEGCGHRPALPHRCRPAGASHSPSLISGLFRAASRLVFSCLITCVFFSSFYIRRRAGRRRSTPFLWWWPYSLRCFCLCGVLGGVVSSRFFVLKMLMAFLSFLLGISYKFLC